MAAFCACCGAEITLRAGACSVCGTPQHGMAQPDHKLEPDTGKHPSQEAIAITRKTRERFSCKP
jgi:predicted amidophosphoribosyltransferase